MYVQKYIICGAGMYTYTYIHVGVGMYACACAHIHTHTHTHTETYMWNRHVDAMGVKVGGQLAEVISVLLPYRPQGSNSGCQVQRHAPFPTGVAHQT